MEIKSLMCFVNLSNALTDLVTLQKHFIDCKIPTLIVASKAEYPEVRQDYELTPAQFCSRFKLPPPQRFTCIDKVNHDVYIKLATMAAYP